MPEVSEVEKKDVANGLEPERMDNPKQESIKDEAISFPSLEKGPAVCYETDRREVWIGIPFDKINNPLMVLCYLDRAKSEVLIHLGQYSEKRAREEMLKSSPAGNRLNGSLKEIFGKAKSLIS